MASGVLPTAMATSRTRPPWSIEIPRATFSGTLFEHRTEEECPPHRARAEPCVDEVSGDDVDSGTS